MTSSSRKFRGRNNHQRLRKTSSPVLALMPMPPEQSRRYGVPVVKEDLDDGLLRITGLSRSRTRGGPCRPSPPAGTF